MQFAIYEKPGQGDSSRCSSGSRYIRCSRLCSAEEKASAGKSGLSLAMEFVATAPLSAIKHVISDILAALRK